MNGLPNKECNHIESLLEAYSLGALSDEERQLTARHLATCVDCCKIVADYEEITSELSESVAGISPYVVPDTLKADLFSEIDRLSNTDQIRVQPAASNLEQGSSASLTVPSGHSTRWMRFAFALATVMLALSLIWSLRLNVTLARERALLAEYAELVEQQEIVLEVIDSDQTNRRLLLPIDDFPTRPYGKIFTRTDLNHVVAMAARLPDTQPGYAYHLWLTEGSQTKLVGIMNVNTDGFGMLVFDEEANNPQYDSAQLTLQSVGGNVPTDNLIIRWDSEN